VILRNSLAIALGWVQGTYFFVLGIWPIFHIESFQAVTGEKSDHLYTLHWDHWLVNTVGALVAVIGLALLVAAWRRQFALEVVLLAASSALALAAVDVFYVWRRAISPIYLGDAAIEVVFAALWAIAFVRQPGSK
jgi:hypothetical protein